jgi:thiol:disulfide interchange protein
MFVFTALVLSREGMQMVPLLTVFLVHVPIVELRIAVVSGLVLAAVAAWTWARQAPRMRRRWFAAATAIILLLGTTQLVIDAWRSTNAPPRVDLEVTLDQ